MDGFWIFVAGFVTAVILNWLRKAPEKINESDPIIVSRRQAAAEPKRRSERELWELIAALDLQQPIEKLRATHSLWSDAHVELAVQSYRQFLFLVGVNTTGSVIPWHNDLDEVWHMHILHTKSYAEDCQRLFGKMIHHDPTVTRGTKSHQEGVTRTNKLRTWYFSPPPKTNERAREDYNSSDSMMPWFLWWSISGSDPAYADTTSSSSDNSSDGRSGGETATTDTGSSSCSSCSSCGGGD